MLALLEKYGPRIKHELRVYRLVLIDERTPRIAKALLWLAIGYAALPFDLIPDFIPVLGYLDDVIVVAALGAVALLMIPSHVVAECRLLATPPDSGRNR